MPGPHGGTVSVAGLCAYCEMPTGTTCRLCGGAMCPDHALEEADVCIGCSARRVDD